VPQVLESYNEEVMYVFDNYFRSVAKECRERMGDDDTLPLSGNRIVPREPFNQSTEGNINCNYHGYQKKKFCGIEQWQKFVTNFVNYIVKHKCSISMNLIW
jgi:hypothetical protein